MFRLKFIFIIQFYSSLVGTYHDGEIQDMEFTRYVYKIADELKKNLNDEELRALYKIKDEPGNEDKEILKKLEKIGIVEKNEQGKFMLAKIYYEYTEQRGTYTRVKGLNKETCKELIIKHLENYKKGYMEEFLEVLRDVPRKTITKYLKELKDEEKIVLVGNPRIVVGKDRAFWKMIQL